MRLRHVRIKLAEANAFVRAHGARGDAMKPGAYEPWDWNEHGLWCSACGNHIAASWTLDDDDYEPPETCKQCGFPDFEEGMGYFTGDAA